MCANKNNSHTTTETVNRDFNRISQKLKITTVQMTDRIEGIEMFIINSDT